MSRARQVQPAIRTGQKARIALSGPTGAGKTFTALIMARELAGPDGSILVIDTERGSASLYSDDFKFDTIDWKPPYDPREIAEDLRTLDADYDVIIADSLTHFWSAEGGTLDIVDAASSRSSGNSYAGWKTGTPAQNAFVEAMLQADCHVIATMRSKMEYVLEANKQGKQIPRKVGMAPVQRDGIEYEFTIGAELDQEHRMIITKSRCSELADKMYQGFQVKDAATQLRDWLNAAPATNIFEEIKAKVPNEETRKALGEAWTAKFPFRSNAVPTDRVEEARQFVEDFAQAERMRPADDGAAS